MGSKLIQTISLFQVTMNLGLKSDITKFVSADKKIAIENLLSICILYVTSDVLSIWGRSNL